MTGNLTKRSQTATVFDICAPLLGKSWIAEKFQRTQRTFLLPASDADMKQAYRSWAYRLRKSTPASFSILENTQCRIKSNAANVDEDTDTEIMYGKIYESTYTGSMFGIGATVLAVWSYVIAYTKPDSMVELNPALLSATIGEPEQKIQEAIGTLCAPDAKSRSKRHEGRRLIKQGEFIYLVPNYSEYHGLNNNEARRQYFREKKREQRQRDRMRQTVKSKTSNNVQQSYTDTYTNTKREEGQTSPPSNWLEEIKKEKAFEGIDVDRELSKAQVWCKQKNRRLTRLFFVRWLNRVDQPLQISAPKTKLDLEYEACQERRRVKQ
jgi:hypothetical protein